MKEETFWILLFGICFYFIGLYSGFSLGNVNSWNNGVLEGRCLEKGGTLHNVDGELTCMGSDENLERCKCYNANGGFKAMNADLVCFNNNNLE